MLRVLHLTDTWGPGGAETVYADLATGTGPPRFESLAGLPRASDWLYETVRERGVQIAILPSSGAFDFAHIRRLISTIRKNRIGLLQAHTLGSSVYASFAGFVCRIPVVSTLHGRVDLALDDKHRDSKFRILGLGRTVVIPVSIALKKELLASTSLEASRTRVIYNGVDVSQFRPGDDPQLRRELGVLQNEILIGAVGNVRPIKGYEVLLRAAAQLKALGFAFKVAIVGQTHGDAFDQIRGLRATLDLERDVVFTGFRSDVVRFYQAFDVYALTSHSEGFPLSILQALAAGLPVVATRCGGPEEILSHENTGLLAGRGSAEEVALELARLISDAGLRQTIGSAARTLAEQRYSTGAMLRDYGALYETLARRGTRATSTDEARRERVRAPETAQT